MNSAATPALLSDLPPTQRAVILRARITRSGGRVQAVDSRSAIALVRKGYATASYRQTSNGVLTDLKLTDRGLKAWSALHKLARA